MAIPMAMTAAEQLPVADVKNRLSEVMDRAGDGVEPVLCVDLAGEMPRVLCRVRRGTALAVDRSDASRCLAGCSLDHVRLVVGHTTYGLHARAPRQLAG